MCLFVGICVDYVYLIGFIGICVVFWMLWLFGLFCGVG